MRSRKRNLQTIFENLEIRRMLAVANLGANNTLIVQGSNSSETIFINRLSNGTVSITGEADRFTPGSGSGQFNKISVTGAGGNDVITISNNVPYLSSTLAGGSGNDTITGGVGADLCSGNDGNDRLDGQGGPDVMTGGSGFDTTNYSARTVALKITMGSGANDGANNGAEGDDVQTEEVLCGSGNDTVTGTSGDDYISGGAGRDSIRGGGGNDVITASTGQDSVFGENGDDFLQAQNQDTDVVNGGTNSDGSPDLDLASIDAIDVSGAASAAPTALGAPSNFPLFGPPIAQAPGDFDLNFGDNGQVLGDDMAWNDITATAVDSLGRVIVVGSTYSFSGSYDFAVTRYNADGSLDTGFGYGQATVDFDDGSGYGYASFDDFAYGVTVDENDNVIVVGSTNSYEGESYNPKIAVARLREVDGFLDTAFSGDGRYTQEISTNFGDYEEANDVAVQEDGRIVVVGHHSYYSGGEFFTSDFFAIRLDANGVFDSNFNDGGNVKIVDVGLYDHRPSVALQNLSLDEGAQRIVLGGTDGEDFALARLTPDGSTDTTFGTGGTTTTDFGAYESIRDLAVDADNTIYAAGVSDNRIAAAPPGTEGAPPVNEVGGVLAKYADNGTFINQVETSSPNTGYVEWNGLTISGEKVLVAGTDGEDFLLQRFEKASLSPDPSFGAKTDFGFSDNTPFDSALDVYVRPDGKILAAGTSNQNNDNDLRAALAQYEGGGDGPVQPPGSEEIDVTETDIIDDEDLFGPNPIEPLATRLTQLSDESRMYILAQPDKNGVANINLGSGNDLITFEIIIGEDGEEVLAVNVNGLVLFYKHTTPVMLNGVEFFSAAPAAIGDPLSLLKLNLGAGNDKVLGSSKVNVPMFIDAGDGHDIITGSNLDDVILAGKGNDIVDANNGADIIVGGDGNDLLLSADGNDIIIGGNGIDGIGGGKMGDILIPGTTSYDNNPDALMKIRDEWASGNAYNTRILNIQTGGGLTDGFKLSVASVGRTVFNDKTIDFLYGASGQDWFFASKAKKFSDILIGRKNDETITLI